jgi:cobalt-precorrin 5A hydrolase/precorrin-3B C17-methyltransferase
VIEAAIARVCRAGHLAEGAIAGIASLDLKADEVGLVALCEARGWPLRCFTAEALKAIPVPNPSSVVEQAVQTPSVAEAAAILAAEGELRVPKQVVRVEGQPGAVTVAIAQADREYIPHPGHLALVGTGPGDLNQITPAAKAAIAKADVVIGYGLYIDQIRPLCRPGQIVEPWPITQERQRCDRAIDLARWGLSVAVVSSGDCGIYGMAGLVLEQLQGTGWDGETPSVEVFPGISALQAAAARVGAPLMHDFCAISLSDLLTPWPVILKRLEAAAQADFVVALYNPKSKTRTEQIAIAHGIFMAHRSPDTPVAVVKSVYRPDETIHRTTLGALLEAPIDMLTVVLIGNQSTQRHGPWLITPRGYNGSPEG